MKTLIVAAALALSTSAALACGTQITDPFPCALAPSMQEITTGHYLPGHWHIEDYRRWNHAQQQQFYEQHRNLPWVYAPPPMPHYTHSSGSGR